MSLLKNNIFKISSETEFNQTALETFLFQYEKNPVYRKYCDLLKIKKREVNTLREIPFLPIQFFKSHKVISSSQKPQQVFYSSGTTGSTPSKHFVTDLSLYKKSFIASFEKFYGKVENYVVLGLLPSYLERKGSSLVYMVNAFIKKSKFRESGFYLDEFSKLKEILEKTNFEGKKVLLFGVSFALRELAEKFPGKLENTIVMETGGMKGRGKEPVRSELHAVLCEKFGLEKIHSEYGMTELLSQAYSKGNGIFQCPKHMKILIRDPEDPFRFLSDQKTGGINIIDLANLNSCSFLATQDLGKKSEKGVEILGRFDNSDLRGCNLMAL